MSSRSDTAELSRQQEINSRLTTLVNGANGAIIDGVSTALQNFDLTPTQYATLLMLGCNPGTSSARLARLVNVTPQSMGVIVTKLEDRGLVQRDPAEIHPRVLSVKLTTRGAKLAGVADEAAQAVERRIKEALSADEVAQFRELLTKVHGALKP